MGKGAGNCFSDPKTTPNKEAAASPAAEQKPAAQEVVAVPTVQKPITMSTNKKVFIIYYSMYGHVEKMALAIKEGVDSIEGVEGVLYQVPELLSADILTKMHAPPKSDYPIIDPHIIDQADGFAFGFPTRYGMMAAQMKAFFDATGQHWQKQSLAGKAATLFVSTATQGGGQETTILTAVTQLAHHGMLYVPTGYGAGGPMFGVEVAKGGSPYGAGTLAGGDGSRQPSAEELVVAKYQGTQLAKIVKKLTA